MPSSAVVLLSSGLDSTVNLYKAAREGFQVKLALTFDYGQTAAPRERAAAAKISSRLNVPHKIIELPWFRDFTHTSLVSGSGLPVGAEVEIDNLSRSMETARSVWVPNRNGILLNIAAGFAEGLGAEYVVPGFNFEEAQTFPDNSSAFLKSLDEAWSFSTNGRVRPHCFTTDLTKLQILREAIDLGVSLTEVWPCYQAGAKWCGECESCKRFERALAANGLSFRELQEGRT